MGPVVGFVGLTHLGVVSSLAVAARGFEVVAHDGDAKLVADVAGGRFPIVEPGLDELFRAASSTYETTSDAADLSRCDVVYVSVDVPTDDAGTSDLTPVRAAVDLALASARDDATVVVLSQVPPGFTRPLHDVDARVRYQVETLIFGRAVERATTPERFIVGCPDPAEPLPAAMTGLLGDFGCPILPMRFESAELCKIAINLFLAATVTTTNTLAGVCEVVGADWREIAPALRLDARIGPHAYLAPGLGLAGGNIERDLATTAGVGAQRGASTGMVTAVVRDSEHRHGWALRHLGPVLGREGSVVALLGLAYKPGTASIKGSPGVELLGALHGVTTRWHDPVVTSSPTGEAGAVDALDACRGADAVVLATAWDDYRSLDVAAMAAAMRGTLVVDPHGVLDDTACREAGLTHHVLGRGWS